MPDPTWRQIVALLILVLGFLAAGALGGVLILVEQGRCCG